MDRASWRRIQGELSKQVDEIICRENPAGLIAMGCPPDEYSEEVAEIVWGLRLCESPGDIERLLDRVFRESFDAGALPSARCRILAGQIRAAIDDIGQRSARGE